MNNQIWIVISKIFALLLIVYSIILLKEIYHDIKQYYANPTAYNGFTGVIIYNMMSTLVALVALAGSLLYLFNKKIGWVLMCANMILGTLFITLNAFAVFTTGKDKLTGAFFSIVTGALVSLGLVGLCAKSTRQAYGITKNNIIISVVIAVLLALVYFAISKFETSLIV